MTALNFKMRLGNVSLTQKGAKCAGGGGREWHKMNDQQQF